MQRHLRLTNKADFAAIQERGASWSNRLLVLKAIPNGLEHSRFGFAIGKRVGNAVTRNRVRRRLREVLRLSPVKGGWDLLLIARTGTANTDFQGISMALEDLLRRSNLMATDIGERAR